MPVDTQQILSDAEKLGKLVAEHPAIARYRDAQQAAAQDPDANRLLGEFNRQLETLARQEASGMGITDSQRQALESLQTQIASHLRIKALHMAQVEYLDLLRKVNQTVQKQLVEPASRPASPPSASGPRLSL
jgi:cell fate (sporulation/competence/biofilm development) regulator YlbF (YheA/YmcA/DUF963 family)